MDRVAAGAKMSTHATCKAPPDGEVECTEEKRGPLKNRYLCNNWRRQDGPTCVMLQNLSGWWKAVRSPERNCGHGYVQVMTRLPSHTLMR